MTPSLTRPRRLLLALVCATSVANVYYAQPLLERIGTDLGIPTSRLGFVVAVAQAGYLVGLVGLVPLGDRVDRRALVPAHLLLVAVGATLVGLAPTSSLLYAGLAVTGLFSVVVQVAVAWTASLSDPAERGRNIGAVTGGVVVGIIAARTVAGLVADLAGWRAVYLGAAALAVLMSLATRWLLPADGRRSPAGPYRLAVASVVVLSATDRVFRTRGLIAFFVFASFGVFWSGLDLPLSDPPWHLTSTQIGLYGFAGLAGTLAAARAGRWADRGRAQVVTVSALVLLIASWWSTGELRHGLWLAAVGAVLLDLAVQAVHVTNQGLIVAADPASSSRIIGSYMVFYSLGSALGAVTTATLYGLAGWPAASFAGAGFAAAALVVWLVDRAVPTATRVPRPASKSTCPV